MNREMNTLDLIRVLRSARQQRSSYLPMWEDIARGHYKQLRSIWLQTNNKTMQEWRDLEKSVQLMMWQGGNHAEDWLKFVYKQIMLGDEVKCHEAC